MAVITIPQTSGVGPNRYTLVAAVTGSVATPIATTGTGSTSYTFTLPASIIIPPGLITPNSQVWVDVSTKRTGANATAQIEAYLGTANTNGDSLVARVSNNATDGHIAWLFAPARFGTSKTSFIGTGVSTPQGSNAPGSSHGDKSTNVNTDATMYVNFGVSSANVADSFALLYYRVWVLN